MLTLLKRYREVIAVAALTLASFAVFLAHARDPSDRTALDRVVLTLTSPLEKVVDWGISGALGTWNRYVWLVGTRERADAIAREAGELRRENVRLSQYQAENERLERLLGFARSRPQARVVGARVVGTRMDPKGLQLVTVDRGEKDGVRRMMPVVTADGVVGRVHAVSGGSADVLLLVDRNSSIAVRADRSRARANVRGSGSPGPCRLEYALRSDDLIEGDLLVTSGTDGVFPRGLPVGKASRVRRGGYGLYQIGEVLPAVDVTRIEEVLVLLSDATDEEEPAAQAPAR